MEIVGCVNLKVGYKLHGDVHIAAVHTRRSILKHNQAHALVDGVVRNTENLSLAVRIAVALSTKL